MIRFQISGFIYTCVCTNTHLCTS